MADSQKGSNDNVIKPSVLQSPIIMKVDGPSDDHCKKENDLNKDSEEKFEDNVKMCSPSFRPNQLSSNHPFAINQSKITRSILKPPQLNVNNLPHQNNKPFILKPSQLNPLAKSSESSSEKMNTENSDKPSIENGDKNSRVANGEPPKFLPLLQENKKPQASSSTSNKQPTSTAPTVSNCSFVFGQNLKDRVIANESEIESTEPEPSTSVSSNGTKENTSEMLFSSAIKSDSKSEGISKEKEVKSLSESAREYEESRTSKRKYEEVEVFTGEENENNILKISCKLFAFDNSSGSWKERGRGTLRLNDFQVDDHIASRIVFRTTGSLRVILNTMIWAKMTIHKASEKSIRLTALDTKGEVKVFLIMASIEDSNKLYIHLQERLEREIASQKRKKSTNEETNISDN